MNDYKNKEDGITNKLVIRKKLESMIGHTIKVYVDRPIGSHHPKHNDIIYPINYGYIKEIIVDDKEYQDVYILGEDKSLDCVEGKIYAIIERENDNEDKLIVVTNNKEYSNEEIRKLVDFQEKYFKYKIIK